MSRHFQLPPNRVAVTVFSGELNAELLGASRLLWLGSRGSLGSLLAFAPLGGRSTALTVAGHDAQRRRVSAGVRSSRGQPFPHRFKPSHLPRKLRRSSLVL